MALPRQGRRKLRPGYARGRGSESTGATKRGFTDHIYTHSMQGRALGEKLTDRNLKQR